MSDHPFFFTWTSQRHARPIDIVGGDGVHFDTASGRRWLDLASLVYQANLGHGHPRMIQAIQRQAGELSLSIPNAVYDAKVRLARELLEIAPPGFSKVFFTLGGTEANEHALKIARMVTGRFKTISRYRSYHGATMGALSLTGDWRRPPLEPGLTGAIHALDSYCDRCPFGQRLETCHRECATHISDLLDLEGPRSVSAVFLESIPGSNGVMVPPPEYWPMVREACDRHGTLLVADEVLTGFGRTGKWFGFQHWDVVPDLITMAKGLTGGYAPLGAVLVHDRVARHFNEKTLVSGLTHYAHPLGCAAGAEALSVYRDEALVENAARLEAPLLDGMRAIAQRLDRGRVVAVRGKGLLAAMELSADDHEWVRLQAALEDRAILTHVLPRYRVLVLSPPLIITREQLEVGLAGVEDALQEALA